MNLLDDKKSVTKTFRVSKDTADTLKALSVNTGIKMSTILTYAIHLLNNPTNEEFKRWQNKYEETQFIKKHKNTL